MIFTFFLNFRRNIFLKFRSRLTINLFPEFVPGYSIHIRPNTTPANQILIPRRMTRKDDTERGENIPMVNNKTEELSAEALRSNCVWNCLKNDCLVGSFFKKYSYAIMDKKIVQNANIVLHKKYEQDAADAEKEESTKRIEEIEKSIREILEELKKK
jgi:hypothetical protein